MEDVHRGVAHLASVALLERERGQRPEGLIGEFFPEEHRHARIRAVLAHFVVDAPACDGEHRVLVVVERARGLEVHGGAQRAFLDIRGRRLAHGQLRKDFRREDIEVEAAAVVAGAIDVAGARLGRAFHAIDAHLGEAGRQAANRDVAAFAAITPRERHARNSLHRLREVAVRKFADVFGGDDIDGGGLLALRGDRSVQRSAETGYHHLFKFL